MTKKTMMMMFLAMMVGGCFPMEDLPLEDDAEAPPVEEEIDAATPAPSPDAAVLATPDAESTEESDAEVPETPDSGITPECDAATPDVTPETPDATPAPSPDAAPPTPVDAGTPDADCGCDSDGTCSDGFAWTSDTCVGTTCSNTPTTCGGMRVRPSAAAVTCEFWDGFGLPSGSSLGGPLAIIGLASSVADGTGWKLSPESACSGICYDSSWARAPLDIKIEWNGVTFVSAEVDGLTKGTWDGNNVEHP